MTSLKNLISALLISLVFACAEKSIDSQIEFLQEIEVSGSKSHLPRLFVEDNGEVFMSWVTENENTATLQYAHLKGNAWKVRKVIAQGDDWFLNWADFPAFVKNGGALTAHFLQKSAEGTYDYDVMLTQSNDNGETWSEPFVLHNDGVAAEHGFVSMAPMDSARTFISWLDGRNMVGGHGHHAGGMTIRGAIVNQFGQIENRWEIDDRVCECCQTASVLTPKGPVVVFRNRTENEVRDISISRLVGGKWTATKPIGFDHWKIDGCPVNGPAVATSNSHLAVAWFTAAQESARVQLAISSDWGENFSQPIMVGMNNTIGRVGITALSDGSFVVSWLRVTSNNAEIMVSRYDMHGQLINQLVVDKTSMERSSGFPVIKSNDKTVLLAWAVSNETPKIKSATIKF